MILRPHGTAEKTSIEAGALRISDYLAKSLNRTKKAQTSYPSLKRESIHDLEIAPMAPIQAQYNYTSCESANPIKEKCPKDPNLIATTALIQ